MRLLSLELAGFRGFATKQAFDLNADAVIVVGANGNGKTSLVDAVLWAIAGRIPRLGADDVPLVCKFSETGQARVSLRLGRADGSSPLTVTRVFDGARTTVSVETAEGVVRGPQAEGRLIQQIWQEAAAAANPPEALATAVTRSVYLQQDLVREFIDSATAQERFSAVSELVGAGRVTDLQGELERAKRAWSQATNSRVAELEPLRSRLSAMESRLNELRARPTSTEAGLDETAWSEWWSRMQAMGLQVSAVPMTSRDATSAIDNAILQADAARRATERRQALLEALAREISGVAARTLPDLTALRGKVAAAQQQVQQTRAKVSAEQARVAEARRLQAELKEKSQQLQALAVLALKHLGEKCPVCDQEYNVEATRRRLERTAAGASAPGGAPPMADTLPGLLQSLASDEKELSAAELELRTAEQSIRNAEATDLSIDKRLKELGIVVKSAPERLHAVAAAVKATSLRSDELGTAQRIGEAFALRLSRIGDQAAIQELQREVETTRLKLQREDREIQKRAATGEHAQRVIEALREAASRVVTERVKEIEPLLSDIYSRIDAHPAFRVVRFLASVSRGRGLLATVVSDPLSEIQSDAPATVLSSSQMNALAVCIFLSLNLGVSRPPLDAAILDDPLQSLDDINLLGLIDLLRRTKDQRQLFVSTHDSRFGQLLARKLRPGSSEQRTVVIELEGWGRTGPAVLARDIHSDPVPLRLVTASSGRRER
jgi:DNA repair exonuclease SbcCD ATPase subunit